MKIINKNFGKNKIINLMTIIDFIKLSKKNLKQIN
jgi:hypothetical protein